MKLQQLTDKICELLKGTELDPKLGLDWDILPIREAEVLKSLSNIRDCSEYSINQTNTLLKRYGYQVKECYWHLGKPLHEQSEETINFLHQILVR